MPSPSNVVVWLAALSPLLALLTFASGCGSSSSSDEPPTASTESSTFSDEESAIASHPSPRHLSGITFTGCRGGEGIAAYNVPASGGAVSMAGTWTWPFAAEGRYGPTFGCNAGGRVFTVGWLERQQFNTDFTEMAVSDNGIAAMAESGSGMRDVGPQMSTDYGGQAPAQASPLFRPGTDTIWYVDHNRENRLFSVDGRHGVGRGIEDVATHQQALAPAGEALDELRQIEGRVSNEAVYCGLQAFVSDTAVVSPDAKEIAFLSDSAAGVALFAVSAEGGSPHKLADLGDLTENVSSLALLEWR